MEVFKAEMFALCYWITTIAAGYAWSELQYKNYIHIDQDGNMDYVSILDELKLCWKNDNSKNQLALLSKKMS